MENININASNKSSGNFIRNLTVSFLFLMALSSLFQCREVCAQAGIITTVAGSDNLSLGDGGPATDAALRGPRGVFVDNTGNIFIADTNGNRIRKVDALTGLITTVAGGGNIPDDAFDDGIITGDELGDGGTATDAILLIPNRVVVDDTGNIFIADFDNNRIRKVDGTTGIITTEAGNGRSTFSGDGGPATDAALFFPFGVFVDDAGNIFIADTNNNRIRKVSSGETPTIPAPTLTPSPTQEPTSTPTPSPEPTPTPDNVGKSFTFKCNKDFQAGFGGTERLILKLGEDEHCTLKLTNLEPGIPVEISSQLRKGLRSSIKIEPARSVADANGELEITIIAIRKGIAWAAWAVKNDKGEFDFSKKAYDAGLAWGLLVEVR